MGLFVRVRCIRAIGLVGLGSSFWVCRLVCGYLGLIGDIEMNGGKSWFLKGFFFGFGSLGYLFVYFCFRRLESYIGFVGFEVVVRLGGDWG